MENKEILTVMEMQQIYGGKKKGAGACLAGMAGAGITGGITVGGAGSALGPAGTALGGLYGTLGGILTGYATFC